MRVAYASSCWSLADMAAVAGTSPATSSGRAHFSSRIDKRVIVFSSLKLWPSFRRFGTSIYGRMGKALLVYRSIVYQIRK
jgi:hypothetical protein